MQGRIWNGTHRQTMELRFGRYRLGEFCLTLLALLLLSAFIFGIVVDDFGTLLMVFAPITLVVAIVIIRTSKLCLLIDPEHARPEWSIIRTLVHGARHRTHENLD